MRRVGQSSFRAHPRLETSLSHDALHPMVLYISAPFGEAEAD